MTDCALRSSDDLLPLLLSPVPGSTDLDFPSLRTTSCAHVSRPSIDMPGLPPMLFEELLPLQPRFNVSPTAATFVPTPEKFRIVSDTHYNVACAILILTPIVHAFSTLLLVGRAYTRMVPTFRFGLDDYLICVAWVRGLRDGEHFALSWISANAV